jgi:hypothetical protein
MIYTKLREAERNSWNGFECKLFNEINAIQSIAMLKASAVMII